MKERDREDQRKDEIERDRERGRERESSTWYNMDLLRLMKAS